VRHRLLATGLPTVVIAMIGIVSVSLVGQAPGPGQADYTAPRTPWGDPDLQGMWDTRTYTRPVRHAGVHDRGRSG